MRQGPMRRGAFVIALMVGLLMAAPAFAMPPSPRLVEMAEKDSAIARRLNDVKRTKRAKGVDKVKPSVSLQSGEDGVGFVAQSVPQAFTIGQASLILTFPNAATTMLP